MDWKNIETWFYLLSIIVISATICYFIAIVIIKALTYHYKKSLNTLSMFDDKFDVDNKKELMDSVEKLDLEYSNNKSLNLFTSFLFCRTLKYRYKELKSFDNSNIFRIILMSFIISIDGKVFVYRLSSYRPTHDKKSLILKYAVDETKIKNLDNELLSTYKQILKFKIIIPGFKTKSFLLNKKFIKLINFDEKINSKKLIKINQNVRFITTTQKTFINKILPIYSDFFFSHMVGVKGMSINKCMKLFKKYLSNHSITLNLKK